LGSREFKVGQKRPGKQRCNPQHPQRCEHLPAPGWKKRARRHWPRGHGSWF